MASFYIGPDRPRLQVHSWNQLVAAAQVGALRETHWVESKRAVPASSDIANEELARDLASLSVDGGVFLVGIRNPGQTAEDVVGTSDDLEQLRQRIDQISGSTIHPALHIETHPVVHPDDPSRAVLVVHVPPSPNAPHMVDVRYWGRSATGKRPLVDDEVRRLWELRRQRQGRFEESMAETVALDPLPDRRRYGHLYLTAQPMTPPLASLPKVLRAVDLRQVVRDSLPGRGLTPPSLKSMDMSRPHPDGQMLVASLFEDRRNEQELLQLLLTDDNAVRLVSGYGTRMRTPDVAGVNTRHVLGITHQYLVLLGYLSRQYLEYAGSWDLGIQLDRLRGLYSSQVHEPGMSGQLYVAPYAQDSFEQRIAATTAELVEAVPVVVEQLLGRLMRGLGLDRFFFPYEDVAEVLQR